MDPCMALAMPRQPFLALLLVVAAMLLLTDVAAADGPVSLPKPPAPKIEAPKPPPVKVEAPTPPPPPVKVEAPKALEPKGESKPATVKVESKPPEVRVEVKTPAVKVEASTEHKSASVEVGPSTPAAATSSEDQLGDTANVSGTLPEPLAPALREPDATPVADVVQPVGEADLVEPIVA